MVFSPSITEGEGKVYAFCIHIGRSIINVMTKLPIMLGYEPLSDVRCRLPTTTRKDPGAKELRDALKALYPLLDFRAAVLAYTGTPITVIWPIDNGRSNVTRTSRRLIVKTAIGWHTRCFRSGWVSQRTDP
jgi:hypothetical protein